MFNKKTGLKLLVGLGFIILCFIFIASYSRNEVLAECCERNCPCGTTPDGSPKCDSTCSCKREAEHCDGDGDGDDDNPQKGFFDVANCSRLVGWTCDPDNYNVAVAVHFYIDNQAGSGGVFVGSTTAQTSRPDIANASACGTGNPNHGFDLSPLSLQYRNLLFNNAQHKIYAHAINIPTDPSKNFPLTNSSNHDLKYIVMGPCALPTPTRTPTPSPSRTPTPTPTRTPTPTVTPGGGPTNTPTPSATPPAGATNTPTPTVTPGGAPTNTPTPTPTSLPPGSYLINIGEKASMLIKIISGTGPAAEIKFKAKLAHTEFKPDVYTDHPEMYMKLRVVDELSFIQDQGSEVTCESPGLGGKDMLVPMRADDDKVFVPVTQISPLPPPGLPVAKVSSDGWVKLDGIKAAPDKYYTVILKAPKTRGTKMVEHIKLVERQHQSQEFNWIDNPLAPGDLPDPNKEMKQDCVVNSIDVELIESRLGKTDSADLTVADVNYDGIVSGADVSKVVNTLSTKPDDD